MRIASAEALARLLTERLAESGDPGRAVTVAQLMARILPYALVRERLGLAGKAEYDLALLKLLTDRVLLQLDPALHEAAAKELDQPEPDLRPIEKLSESLLRVRDPAGLARRAVETGGEPAAERDGKLVPEDGGEAVAECDEEPAAGPEMEPAAAAPPTARSPIPHAPDPAWREVDPPAPDRPAPGPAADPPGVEPAPGPWSAGSPPGVSPPAASPAVVCWSCAGPLPVREGARFCPRCGVDQQAARCAYCGDRLEPGWSYCPRCGRALGRP